MRTFEEVRMGTPWERVLSGILVLGILLVPQQLWAQGTQPEILVREPEVQGFEAWNVPEACYQAFLPFAGPPGQLKDPQFRIAFSLFAEKVSNCEPGGPPGRWICSDEHHGDNEIYGNLWARVVHLESRERVEPIFTQRNPQSLSAISIVEPWKLPIWSATEDAERLVRISADQTVPLNAFLEYSLSPDHVSMPSALLQVGVFDLFEDDTGGDDRLADRETMEFNLCNLIGKGTDRFGPFTHGTGGQQDILWIEITAEAILPGGELEIPDRGVTVANLSRDRGTLYGLVLSILTSTSPDGSTSQRVWADPFEIRFLQTLTWTPSQSTAHNRGLGRPEPAGVLLYQSQSARDDVESDIDQAIAASILALGGRAIASATVFNPSISPNFFSVIVDFTRSRLENSDTIYRNLALAGIDLETIDVGSPINGCDYHNGALILATATETQSTACWNQPDQDHSPGACRWARPIVEGQNVRTALIRYLEGCL